MIDSSLSRHLTWKWLHLTQELHNYLIRLVGKVGENLTA